MITRNISRTKRIDITLLLNARDCMSSSRKFVRQVWRGHSCPRLLAFGLVLGFHRSRSHRLFHSMYVHARAKLSNSDERTGNHQVGRNFNELQSGAIRLPQQFANAFCGTKVGTAFCRTPNHVGADALVRPNRPKHVSNVTALPTRE